jgi:membrane-associated phospholipid phosphatase
MPSFRAWELASALFFVYAAAASTLLPPIGVLHIWIIPPLLLLLAYWSSGCLFVVPMERAERALAAFDRVLGIRQIAARTPRLVVELLEISYAGVYPAIPIALLIYLTYTAAPDPDRFWAVLLVTDYICFGCLPWIQTRPPRVVESGRPWDSRVRRFNERLLRTASIHVNTFPSGHAAEALAVALLVLHAPPAAIAWMFFSASAISAGAVLGRYHYALDAVAGWAVALAVWTALR